MNYFQRKILMDLKLELKDIDYKFVLSKQSDGALYHNYKVEDYMAEVTL